MYYLQPAYLLLSNCYEFRYKINIGNNPRGLPIQANYPAELSSWHEIFLLIRSGDPVLFKEIHCSLKILVWASPAATHNAIKALLKARLFVAQNTGY
jgi:hypothetical protein